MTIFQHPFIKYFRLERKLTKRKTSLKSLGVALQIQFIRDEFLLTDEFKNGYYLSGREFVHFTSWASDKLLKI